MTLDLKKVGSIVQDAQSLVDKIRSQTVSLSDAANAVDAARNALSQALSTAPGASVPVGFADDAQKEILAAIVDLKQQIANAEALGDNALRGILLADLSNQFLALSATQNPIPGRILNLSATDVAQVGTLINAAKLDAAKRQQRAAVLGAAVSVSEAALKIAATILA